MKLKDKVFVVTGGGNGVGRELVFNLLAKGARVAAVDINLRALEETADCSGEYKDKLTTHEANVADLKSIASLAEQIITKHGAVDGIINNAGIIQPFLDVINTSFDTAQRVISINFYGALNMVKTFLPYLCIRPEAYIINVSSSGALTPVPGQTIYGASKAAVKVLTEGLRSELKNTRVRVMTVFLGGISSNIIDNSGVQTNMREAELRKKFSFLLLTPQKTANIIIRGIIRNRSRLTPGIDACMMDFFCRLSPVFAPRMIYKIINAVLQQ
jgi:NAD(P)-dependent dehydrogenase (short-subunit alcohol dehydrogenase family)